MTSKNTAEYNRDYYQKNKEVIKARTKRHYEERMAHLNPEDRREWQRATRNTIGGRANSLCHAAKARAKRQGVAFDLDAAWVRDQLEQGCALTELPFNYNPKEGFASPYSPSIDRMDAGGPYTKVNCRVILWGVNAGLSTWGIDTYLTLAQAIKDEFKEAFE